MASVYSMGGGDDFHLSLLVLGGSQSLAISWICPGQMSKTGSTGLDIKNYSVRL
jgi:hypothetical protein